MRLEHPNASAEAALTMLAQLSPAQSGEALHGLLALARHQLACQPAFIAGFSSHLNQPSDADFINALPDLRAAMASYRHENAGHWRIRCLNIINWRNFPFRRCKCRCIAHHKPLHIINNSNSRHWHRCKTGEFSMSELNDLLTTRELQRWRLILGEAAETTLCGLDDNARQIDHALEWLYGRDLNGSSVVNAPVD